MCSTAGITGGTIDVREAALLPDLDWQTLGKWSRCPAMTDC